MHRFIDDEEEICCHCNGSGEGMYDGTRCTYCKGSGIEYVLKEEDVINCKGEGVEYDS